MKADINSVLEINCSEILAKTPLADAAYLQIVAPKWMHHPTYQHYLTSLQALPTLYQNGKVVWAAIVQANTLLFETSPISCPAEIVYDPNGCTSLQELHEVAHRLFTLKNTEPSNPEEAKLAQRITHELGAAYQKIPSSISSKPLLLASIFLWRPHLLNGELNFYALPILISEQCPGCVTVLPARFWETHWLSLEWQANSTQDPRLDLSDAFYVKNSEANGNFWSDIPEEYIYPSRNELIKLTDSNQLTSTKIIRDEDDENGNASDNFLQQCYDYALSDHQKLPESDVSTDEVPLSTHQTNRYRLIKWIIYVFILLIVIHHIFKTFI